MEAARRLAEEKFRREAELARKKEIMISQMEQEELALIEVPYRSVDQHNPYSLIS